MNENQALSELKCRYRDFMKWTDTQGMNEDVSLETKVTVIRDLFEKVKSHDSSWKIGGFKRNDLDEAFQVLGLPPLEG